MKSLQLSTTLLILTAIAAHAQGTIMFANSALTRVQWLVSGDAGHGTYVNVPIGAPIVYGVFWGTAADDLHLDDGPLGTASTTSAGLIVAPNPYGIAGATPGSSVYMKIAGWNTQFGRDYRTAKVTSPLDGLAYYGETAIRQITLGPADAGTTIWSGANPSLFQPLKLDLAPEPSVLALGTLGVVVLFVRRSLRR